MSGGTLGVRVRRARAAWKARVAVVALLAALLPAPRPVAASAIGDLVLKGYRRDLKSCQRKWKGVLGRCKQAANPTLKNNCGIPRPTTTTSTTTTTTTLAPTCPASTVTTTTTTSTTVKGCDTVVSWADCGPADRGCTCHHRKDGSFGDYVCADVGPRVRPTYVCIGGCSTDQDCVDCSDDQNAICIGGASGEPPRGACVSRCDTPSPTVRTKLAPHADAAAGCGKGTICRTAIESGFANCKATARGKWQAIAQVCRAAKKAKNRAACTQAIKAGYASTVANVAVRPAITCPDGFPVDCGTGVCCPADFPVCCTQTKCCPGDFPVCGTDDVCHQDVSPTTTTTTSSLPDCGTPTTTVPGGGACQSYGDQCSPDHCLGLPAGECSVHCPGGDLVCIGFVAVYSDCTSDADCPPKDDPALFDNTICITRGSETDPETCSTLKGVCSKPCS